VHEQERRRFEFTAQRGASYEERLTLELRPAATRWLTRGFVGRGVVDVYEMKLQCRSGSGVRSPAAGYD
jgi:hypothetical protein